MIILDNFKKYFGCGNINIDNNRTNGYKFIISKKSDLLNIVIPHFENYLLVGSKHLDFLDFKKCVLLMNEGENNLSYLNEVISIKKGMNKGKLYDTRWNYLKNKTFDLKPEWVQAFIDGEGTFQCRIADAVSRDSKYTSINPTLEIAQNSHDVFVLNAIIKFFGIGYLKPKYDITSLDASKSSRSVSRAIFNQSKYIINFVDKYPMFTRKHLDFLDWKEIVTLKQKNTHKTMDGKNHMLGLKQGMNRGRLLNCNLLSGSDKFKVLNSSKLSIGIKQYHTKVHKNNGISAWVLFTSILLLTIGGLAIWDYNLLIICLNKVLFILFFFCFTVFYIDNFKLSNNKFIKYYQVIIFILFITYIIYICIGGYVLINDTICRINPDEVKDALQNKDIKLEGKIVMDKTAGAEVAKGLSTFGSNVGLGACVGALAGGVAKSIANTSIPPFQKAGLIVASGIAGAILHTGASAINAQTHAAAHINKSSDSTSKDTLPKDINQFIGNVDDSTPLEILIQCISILNSLCIWIIIFLSMQILFKTISDKPKLKFLGSLMPHYSEKIKLYIYKLISINKNLNLFYSIFALGLLFICTLGSVYFSLELHNNLNSYVDVYINLSKK